jgi:hypothetical protein
MPSERVFELAHLPVDLAELYGLLLEQLRRPLSLAVQLVDERAEVEQERLTQAALAAQAASHQGALSGGWQGRLPPL